MGHSNSTEPVPPIHAIVDYVVAVDVVVCKLLRMLWSGTKVQPFTHMNRVTGLGKWERGSLGHRKGKRFDKNGFKPHLLWNGFRSEICSFVKQF